MTLSSRHRIRNSSPGGLRPSTLPLGHGGSPQYWLSHVDGEETFFVSFKLPRPGTEPRTLAWKAAVLTTTLGPPPFRVHKTNLQLIKASQRQSPASLFLFKISPTWSCVSLLWPTTISSGWKILIFVEFGTKHLQILMFKHSFHSRWLWFDLLIKRTKTTIVGLRG